MSARKKIEPPTQTGGLSDALAARFTESQLPAPKAQQTGSESAASRPGARAGARRSAATRPAPEGMRRVTLYVTSEAAEALEAAAAEVLAAVPIVKKADVLSALLLAATDHAGTVATELKAQVLRELDR
jgi:hypothetical protein